MAQIEPIARMVAELSRPHSRHNKKGGPPKLPSLLALCLRYD